MSKGETTDGYEARPLSCRRDPISEVKRDLLKLELQLMYAEQNAVNGDAGGVNGLRVAVNEDAGALKEALALPSECGQGRCEVRDAKPKYDSEKQARNGKAREKEGGLNFGRGASPRAPSRENQGADEER
eukprot:3954314-Pleurochrysis_carterae.AAC.1